MKSIYLRGLLALSRGICAYFLGRWSVASDECREAAHLFRERCRGVAWEVNTSHAFMLWALFFQGSVREMAQCLPGLLDDAHLRGDRLALASLSNFGGPLVWLAQDRADTAEIALRDSMSVWPSGDFHVQHFTCLAGKLQIMLYQGDAGRAWHYLQTQWPALRRSWYLRIEAIRIFMIHLRARIAVQWAMQAPSKWQARGVGCQARRDANRLLREAAPWAVPLGRLILAGLASIDGDAVAAARSLEEALPQLRNCHLGLFADAAERALACQGGVAAVNRIADVDQRLASHGIVRPSRICGLHVPGQWST